MRNLQKKKWAKEYKEQKTTDVYTPTDPEDGDAVCLGKHSQLEADLQNLHEFISELQWTLNNSKKSKYEVAEDLEHALAEIEQINWLSGGNVKMFRERCDYTRKFKENCDCCKLTELFEVGVGIEKGS